MSRSAAAVPLALWTLMASGGSPSRRLLKDLGRRDTKAAQEA